MPNHIKLNSSN